MTRIGQAETKRLLAQEHDPARSVPDITFDTSYTLRVGGERIELAWHGTNHTADNSYIHFPDHDTLMLVDICLPRWVPYDSFNLNENVQGSIAAPATAMAYPWKHFIGGHMGRLGTRNDMVVYQQYVDDLIAGVKQALAAVDPTADKEAPPDHGDSRDRTPTLARQANCKTGTEYTALVVLGRGGQTSGLLGSAAVLQIGLGHAQFAA